MAAAGRVLVTRPYPLASGLAQELESLGYTVLVHPFLSFEKTKMARPALPPDFVVALTSQMTLRFIDPDILEQSSIKDRCCYCVGEKTARFARSAGFSNIVTGPGHGKGLAGLICRQQSIHTSVLHIGGAEVDGDLRALLSKEGMHYIHWPVYKTEQHNTLPEALLEALRENRLDAALFLSARTAQAFVDAIQKEGAMELCRPVLACALSAKVAAVLSSLPWKKLAVAARPDQTALVASLLNDGS